MGGRAERRGNTAETELKGGVLWKLRGDGVLVVQEDNCILFG